MACGFAGLGFAVPGQRGLTSTAAAGWWLPQGLWHKALTSSTQMWAPFAVQADVIAGARTDGALEENLQLQISERELRMS